MVLLFFLCRALMMCLCRFFISERPLLGFYYFATERVRVMIFINSGNLSAAWDLSFNLCTLTKYFLMQVKGMGAGNYCLWLEMHFVNDHADRQSIIVYSRNDLELLVTVFPWKSTNKPFNNKRWIIELFVLKRLWVWRMHLWVFHYRMWLLHVRCKVYCT